MEIPVAVSYGQSGYAYMAQESTISMLIRSFPPKDEESALKVWDRIYEEHFREITVTGSMAISELLERTLMEFKPHFRTLRRSWAQPFEDALAHLAVNLAADAGIDLDPDRPSHSDPGDKLDPVESVVLLAVPSMKPLCVWPLAGVVVEDAREQLPPADTPISQLELDDTAFLYLIARYNSGGPHYMFTVPDSETLFALFSANQECEPPPRYLVAGPRGAVRRYLQKRGPMLHAAMLYTDEDVELAKYVRMYFSSLNWLTGKHLGVFVIERPSKGAMTEYWRRSLEPKLYRIWGLMGWLSSMPYDRSQAYEIARRLGVAEDQLPCIVVFDKLERPNKLVFPIEAVSPRYFRSLFADLRRAIHSGPIPHVEMPLEPLDTWSADMMPTDVLTEQVPSKTVNAVREEAFRAVEVRFDDILRSLVAIAETQPGRGPVLQFQGRNVVITNPTGTEIRDFQNIDCSGDSNGR